MPKKKILHHIEVDGWVLIVRVFMCLFIVKKGLKTLGVL